MNAKGEVSAAHRALLEAMKDDLLKCLVKRLGGELEIPFEEIDKTSNRTLAMHLVDINAGFRFKLVKK